MKIISITLSISTVFLVSCASNFVDKTGKEWIKFESSHSQVSNYYNPSSIVKNGDLIRVEVMTNWMYAYQTPSSSKVLGEFKCVPGEWQNQYRNIEVENYSKLNMTGYVTKEGASGWGRTTSGNFNLAKILCKN
jgi:hypothetical protein